MNGEPSRDDNGPGRVERRRFRRFAIAGITFQGGSAAVDSATIIASLVHQLTGSALAVGAVTAILRFGWLSPQIFVGFLAQRRGSSLRYYCIGGFGRAACIGALAAVLLFAPFLPAGVLPVAVMGLWTAYSFVSGIVAVPYNDIIARSVESGRRSRLLAVRFLGGGLLALGVAAIAEYTVGRMAFPVSFGVIAALASSLMFVSSIVFVSAGQGDVAIQPKPDATFFAYLKEGARVFREDRFFRTFVVAQWFGGMVLMAMPFYVVQGLQSGLEIQHVAILLGAQTAGALASNPLWGWWGDYVGKASLLRGVAAGRTAPALMILFLIATADLPSQVLLIAFVAIFFILGALANGLTIAGIGFLMEISPDDRRPAYSGYFNALTAPAFLFPLLGGVIVEATATVYVFAVSLAAAAVQSFILMRLRRMAATP